MFGDKRKISPLLDKHDNLKRSVSIYHTDHAVSSEERPAVALRQGRNSSMQLAINAVNSGEAAGIVSAGAGPSLGVYGAEMFSTGRRGQSNGAISIFAVLGSACGLLLIGDLSERFGSFGEAFTLLSICPILVVLLVLVFFPESRNRELEDLNPEDLPSEGTNED